MSSDFFDAIKQGNLEEVQRLLASTPNLVYEKENGLGPIMVAAYNNEPEIADFLADKAGNLTIFEAAAAGKIHQITHQLARDPSLVNAYSDNGFQPLGLACFFGHYQTAEYLIKAGALVNSPSRNELNATPLHSAVAASHTRIVKLLLNNDADPNVREQGGYTPLHAAAQNGHSDIIRILLFNGANLNILSQDGKLPIDMASEAGNQEAAGLLKEGITRRFRVKQPRPKS
jgi:ankyrin repeat protein